MFLRSWVQYRNDEDISCSGVRDGSCLKEEQELVIWRGFLIVELC